VGTTCRRLRVWERRRWAGGDGLGRLGRAMVRGCDGASEPKQQLKGRRQTSGYWAANKNGPEMGEDEGE
jgi:hypothetical protein